MTKLEQQHDRKDMALNTLKIEAYGDSGGNSMRIEQIYALINPECCGPDHKNEDLKGTNFNDLGGAQVFTYTGDNTFELKQILVDDTAVIPDTEPNTNLFSDTTTCDAYIDKFRRVVYGSHGEIHKPAKLKITWGKLTFRGVCTSLNVEYKLFNPDGSTLRALINITLLGSTDFNVKEAAEEKSSPGLTLKRVVQAGDTLPLMTYRIYGNSSYYIEVARHNKLNNIAAIRPGDEISFPPLKK